MPSKPSGLLTVILGVMFLATLAAAVYLQAATAEGAPTWLVAMCPSVLTGMIGLQVPAPSQS